MKNIVITSISIVFLVFSCTLKADGFLEHTGTQNEAAKTLPKKQVKPVAIRLMKNGNNKIIEHPEYTPVIFEQSADFREFNRRFQASRKSEINQYSTRDPSRETELNESDKAELSQNGKIVFTAQRIESWSVSDAGRVAVSAIMWPKVLKENASKSNNATNEKTDANCSGIWVFEKGSKPELVSPKELNCYDVLISPDGKWIAFTGEKIIDTAGNVGEPSIYLLNIENKGCSMIMEKENQREEHTIRPIAWLDGGDTLVIKITIGDGGHTEVRYLKIR